VFSEFSAGDSVLESGTEDPAGHLEEKGGRIREEIVPY